MWTIFRKLRWLAGPVLFLDLIAPAALASSARSVTFHHTKWTSENGLGAVFDIQQSPDGYLWLTTSRGVFRFDGVRFQSVAQATFGAVELNEIDSVYIPPSGGMWLSTISAGLLYWKDGHLTAFPDRRCTPTRKMGRLVQDSDGSLWVQGAAGLFHLRGSVCEQAGPQQGYPGGFAAGLFMDSRGTLWVKTRKGPLLFLPRGRSKFQVSPQGGGPSTSYAFLHEAPDGAIWLSDDQGLRRVAGNPDTPAFPSATKSLPPKDQFGDFTFGANGVLWAVVSRGVQRFDHADRWPLPRALPNTPGEIYTPQEGLSSDAAWNVMIDREGVVWIGTNSGLDRFRRNVLAAAALPPSQEREFGIAPGDNGSVWTGNESLPLTHLGADGVITGFPRTRETLTVRRDHNGTIWSAGAGDFYLWRSSPAGFTPLHYPGEKLNSVVAVAVDSRNDPWITTRDGHAYQFSDSRWIDESKALGKKPGVIGAMTDDARGNVWFAFSDKVVRWDGAAFHKSVREGRGVSETTMSVRDDRVWLGGPGGVQLFRGGEFHTVRCTDPTLPGRVSGVVETSTGDLWVNGFSGITHVPAAELKKWLQDPNVAVSAEPFDESDGLPGLSGEKVPEPSVVEGTDGRLWFATTRGIAWLDPAALEKNRNRLPPPVLVSAIVANGKTYRASSSLTLPARTENLEIDYTALSLAMPGRVFFRYKLDGVDPGWQDVGTRREAYYTKLHPGSYRFQVMACNNDGVWSEAGAGVNFTLSPAWFQTNWFLAACLASGLLLVALIYRLRIRQIAAGINARFEERLAERNRIAQELHDTLLQGFLSASMQVHVAADRLPEDSPVKPLLGRALQLMTQVIDEGRSAVRGLRSSRSLSLDLEESFARIPGEFIGGDAPGGFRVIVEGRRRALNPLLRDEIYRIGREGVINAFRHAHASRVEIELGYGPGDFRLRVRDDGCGIDAQILKAGRDGHFGLTGMRERAERMGARLQVFSRPSNGTEVELTVPGHLAFHDHAASRFRWLRGDRSSVPTPVQNVRRT